jgi:hypothetical protein
LSWKWSASSRRGGSPGPHGSTGRSCGGLADESPPGQFVSARLKTF